MDPAIQRRIVLDFKERIFTLHDPRHIGEALKGTMAGYWRYRVSAYASFAASKTITSSS
ncbi:MAG: type II toxin-antitoxin system RelE family toxin [Geminicoccaceae bacterium]